MWGEPLTKNNSFVRTIYGDNLAAIGLASGNTCASWRTRHLRIRASILKEAMDDECPVPGGVWRLIHLKGSELVADGLTKQLLGQAFAKFCEDLGLRRPTTEKAGCTVETQPKVSRATVVSSEGASTGSSGGFAAVKALTIGSALLAYAKAAEEDTENDGDLCSRNKISAEQGPVPACAFSEQKNLEVSFEEVVLCIQDLADVSFWHFLLVPCTRPTRDLFSELVEWESWCEELAAQPPVEWTTLQPLPRSLSRERVILHTYAGRRRRGDIEWYIDSVAATHPSVVLQVVSVDIVIDADFGDIAKEHTRAF
eukprot:s1768_g4.t1